MTGFIIWKNGELMCNANLVMSLAAGTVFDIAWVMITPSPRAIYKAKMFAVNVCINHRMTHTTNGFYKSLHRFFQKILMVRTKRYTLALYFFKFTSRSTSS